MRCLGWFAVPERLGEAIDLEHEVDPVARCGAGSLPGAVRLSIVGTTLTRSGVDRTLSDLTIGVGVRTATERPRVLIRGTALPATP
jgi:hypothetical protein